MSLTTSVALNGLRNLYRNLRDAYSQLAARPVIKSETNDYDCYWQSKKGGLSPEKIGSLNDYQRFRASWIADRIETGSSVADIGCGDGAIIKALLLRKRIRPLGIDSSKVSISHLNANKIPSILADISHKDTVDIIPSCDHFLLLEVLEHLPDPERILKKLHSKVGKSIFFSFPNTGYFPYRMRLLFGRFPVQWRTHPGEHLRFWTYKDAKWWLKELNMAHLATIHLYEGIPLLNRILPNLFGAGIIVEIKAN